MLNEAMPILCFLVIVAVAIVGPIALVYAFNAYWRKRFFQSYAN